MKKTIKKTEMPTPVKTKKAKKNKLVVDLTAAEDMTDVFAAYGFAKIDANKPLTDIELDAVIQNHIDAFLASMFTWNNAVLLNEDGKYEKLHLSVYNVEPTCVACEAPKKTKKPGLFKRFWNWITRKK